MNLNIFTIVLDGMPYITQHLDVFSQLSEEHTWHWCVVEGYARPVKDTAWCKALEPRYSKDGTGEYLEEIREHPNVTILRDPEWYGKTEMVNAACSQFGKGGVLLQVDADEIWKPYQLERILGIFESQPDLDRMDFKCNYYVGPNLIITSENTYGNHSDYEWRRAWRFWSGREFLKHEPPVMTEESGKAMSPEQTEASGLVFNHYAYHNPDQVAFKQEYYGYENALKHWNRLQAHTEFPAKLKDFFPWVTDEATVDYAYSCKE